MSKVDLVDWTRKVWIAIQISTHSFDCFIVLLNSAVINSNTGFNTEQCSSF